MKKIIVSTCLSITMLAYSNFSLCLVNAESTPGIEQWANPSGISQCIEGVAFDDLITSFGDDAFVYRYSNNKKVIVVTSDGMQKHYTNSNVWGKNYTVVKMRPGTEPPVQEINRELNAGDNLIVKFYKISDSDEYRFFVIGEDYQDTVIKILKNNDDVISIDNYREITEDVFRLAELYVKTDVAVEEFIKEYSVFELNDTSEYMKESAKEKGFTLGFSFGNYELSPELYEAFIKLQNSGMEYEIEPMIAMSSGRTVALVENVLEGEDTYEYAEVVLGDINSDGEVDITDLSELSIALVGDSGLTATQYEAADVDRDGAVKLTDLATLKQYLSKQIESLG